MKKRYSIVQITGVGPTLFALDDAGQVWQLVQSDVGQASRWERAPALPEVEYSVKWVKSQP